MNRIILHAHSGSVTTHPVPKGMNAALLKQALLRWNDGDGSWFLGLTAAEKDWLFKVREEHEAIDKPEEPTIIEGAPCHSLKA